MSLYARAAPFACAAVGASYTYCFGGGGGADDGGEEPEKGEPEQKARATGRRPAGVPAAASRPLAR